MVFLESVEAPLDYTDFTASNGLVTKLERGRRRLGKLGNDLRPPVILAALDLLVFSDDFTAMLPDVAFRSGSLRIEAKAGLSLLTC